jgi:mono/diheme cytochrome c family protein
MIETGQPPTSLNAYHSLPNRCRANAVYALSGPATLVIALPVSVWASQPVDAQTELIANGEYIVQGVGMCADCHTPRGPDRQPIEGQELHGASLQAMAHPLPDGQVRRLKLPDYPPDTPRLNSRPFSRLAARWRERLPAHQCHRTA